MRGTFPTTKRAAVVLPPILREKYLADIKTSLDDPLVVDFEGTLSVVEILAPGLLLVPLERSYCLRGAPPHPARDAQNDCRTIRRGGGLQGGALFKEIGL